MTEVFTLALSFPSVVFTVLLGVVLIYWLFVMAGALHIGEGSDGALDGIDAHGAIAGASKGALEGAAKGALEGAAKGVLEGATKGAIESAFHGAEGHDGAVDGLHHGDADASGSEADGHAGVLAAVLSALRLRQIPATVALSVLTTFCWLVSVVAMQIASRSFGANPALGLRIGVLLLSPVLALPLSSLVCVPLSKAISHREAPTKTKLIGMTCRVRTGKVTDRFGEATLEDGGAGLVVRVRVDGDKPLKRGDLALIIDFDKEEDSFLIEPMDSLLEARKP